MGADQFFTGFVENLGDGVDQLFVHGCVHAEKAFDSEGFQCLGLSRIGTGWDSGADVEGAGCKNFLQFLVSVLQQAAGRLAGQVGQAVDRDSGEAVDGVEFTI